MEGSNQTGRIFANENGMRVCARCIDWQQWGLPAPGKGPCLKSRCEKRLWVLLPLLLLLLLPLLLLLLLLLLSGRHLGNDHSKFNHSWGVREEGKRAETVIHMFYLFVQSHGHPIVCPSFCHFRPLGPTPYLCPHC